MHEFKSLRESLDHLEVGLKNREGGPIVIAGAGPGMGPAMAAHMARLGRSILYLSGAAMTAKNLGEDLTFFLGSDSTVTVDQPNTDEATRPQVVELPELESSPYAEVEPDRLAIMKRSAVLFRLLFDPTPPLVVTSFSSSLRRVLPPLEFKRLCYSFKLGQIVPRDELVQALETAGFLRTPLVDDPGTFAVRGAVVDLFVPLWNHPIRVELDGECIRSIRLFDASTQRTLRPISEASIHPVRDTVRTEGADPRSRLLAAADQAAFPSSKTRRLLEQIETGQRFFGMDCLAPIFHAHMGSLFEYFAENTCVFIEDPHRLIDAADKEMVHLSEQATRRREAHQIALDPEEFILSGKDLANAWSAFQHVQLRTLDITYNANSTSEPSQTVTLRPNALATHTLRAELLAASDLVAAVKKRLQTWMTDGLRVVLVVRDQVHAERLWGLLKSMEIATSRENNRQGWATLFALARKRARSVAIMVGSLQHGMILPADHLVLVTEEEIFGQRSHRSIPKKATEAFGDLSSIHENDLVVHDDHGIGRYRGLTRLSVEGVTQDFVHLQYDGGSLYLPVYRIGVLRRFSGGDSESVRLDKLGGGTWVEKRRRVQTEARKMAEELLMLYAQRKALPGHTFPEPSAIFYEFEETFPFNETPDQAQAIQAVLADMQSPVPMDRLICGDVGYGKTEVALRAALLAILGKKQVAILCPTTVLAEQHHYTISHRFKELPVRIASLSRFRKPSDQRNIVRALAEGHVDLVVGTHRLLSNDVTFKDLGLLVIDEEQRFGVTHKERIKEFRSQVDVLTLTATPIPRTLHMTLAGLREISVIATPPADRLAIRTFVCHFDRELLTDAITKELERGGQVFFLHNRVEDLAKWAREIRAMVPTARVAMAHGQMPSARLEKIMVEFVNGQYDVLCCTTIIESGLDIPRVNTLIVNEADRFGLAQLYQLRGRIGRSHLRAYCYLVLPAGRALAAEAQERLAVLQRFTELGAGFQVATADLELRGAGELLGAKQSGLLAAVGFDAYTRILEEAVAELRGEPIRREHDPEIKVNVPAYLPDDYIPDTGQRLETYRQLARAMNEEEVRALLAGVQDRYGPLPLPAILLGDVMIDKTLVRSLGARAYELGALRMVLALGADTQLDPAKVMRLVQVRDSRWKLTPDMGLYYTFSENERENHLAIARQRLHEVSNCRTA
jgi:transcription-repair coupling factor (superfamily II helicase)